MIIRYWSPSETNKFTFFTELKDRTGRAGSTFKCILRYLILIFKFSIETI